MSFKIEALAALSFPCAPFTLKPYIRGWTRLESRVRTEDFARALRAEARDPLWLLARQWQLLELKGDDAGSPIEARLAMRRTKLARYATHGGPVQNFPHDLPLETVVERETPPLDRIALTQVARAFDKAVRRDVPAQGDRADILAGLQRAYPLDPAHIEGVDDDEARQLAVMTDAHLFDAGRFLADAGFATTIETFAGLSPALSSVAIAAAAAVKAWYAELYAASPTPEDSAWAPAQLAYQFVCATAAGPGQIVLTGDDYAQGRLDWHSVDVAHTDQGPGGGEGAPVPVEEALSFLPTAIRFAGMPSHRYWELEDAKIDLGAMTAHTTDIAKMLLLEIVFAYGNDWCLVPYEVEIGELCETLGLVVRDVFGDLTLVRPADRGPDEDWRRWAMFGLETRTPDDKAAPRLFMPPATTKTMESSPIERVVFLRDEMANLVWAAETTVLSAAGLGVDGEHYARSLASVPIPDPPPALGATARYRLGTDAPANWRPFIPVKRPGSQRSIRLQRARLPQGARDPLGKVLVGPGLAPEPYFLNEEEVPRGGRIVTRSFQRTRWLHGRVVLWLGRRTLTGRGEGRSGLEFDVVGEIPQRA
jgi:hypothetical protein